MIAISGFDNPHPRTCTCPRCGYTHDQGYFNGTIGVIRQTVFYSDGDALQAFAVVASAEHYAAVDRSRELARLPDAPQRRPEPRRDARRSPRMVHAMRCQTRRPRLSLHARAVRVVRSRACRPPSR